MFSVLDTYGNVFNSNYSKTEPKYMPSFTSQETKANPLLEFYSQEQRQNSQQNGISMQEKANNHFERFSWPKENYQWRAEEQLSPQHSDLMNGHQNDHYFEQHSLEDLIGNGQFSLNFLPPGNNGDSLDQHEAQLRHMDEQYAVNDSEGSFTQQVHGFVPNGHLKMEPSNMISMEPCDVIPDPFGKDNFIYIS